MIEMLSFRANGKLLLSGEYLVLHGANALALPLKMGQQLNVMTNIQSNHLHWHSFYQGKVWFECLMDAGDFKILSSSDQEKAATLSLLFTAIRSLDPAFQPMPGTGFETHMDAHPDWGFGSSSTLVSLLSQWSKVDPFVLNGLVFKGSGFDIACATASGPILYVKDQPSRPADLDYPFADHLLLAYSGRKKKTFSEVSAFLKDKKVPPILISELSALTDAFAHCHDQDTFHHLISEHESLVGSLIGQLPVKEQYFNDFTGEVKSLGAWGGDYYLISSALPQREVRKYFENKGLNVIFKWKEIIKT
jgi:mevalonate kinase